MSSTKATQGHRKEKESMSSRGIGGTRKRGRKERGGNAVNSVSMYEIAKK